MKRVRCPKCDNYIIFDETKYQTGQSLVFQCDKCGKQFGIRINTPSQPINSNCGSIIVIENVFHFKQELLSTWGIMSLGNTKKEILSIHLSKQSTRALTSITVQLMCQRTRKGNSVTHCQITTVIPVLLLII